MIPLRECVSLSVNGIREQRSGRNSHFFFRARKTTLSSDPSSPARFVGAAVYRVCHIFRRPGKPRRYLSEAGRASRLGIRGSLNGSGLVWKGGGAGEETVFFVRQIEEHSGQLIGSV